LGHPDIVRAFDTGVFTPPGGSEALPYIALEWLTGQTLKQFLIERRGLRGLAPSRALALLQPVFSAIAHAHAHGVAHRDIKPSNILLARSAHGISAKVLDFGIAKVMQEGANAEHGPGTDTNLRVFSRSHAAPEQLAGEPTGPWTDVHALGLLVGELLANRAPYPSDDGVELARLALDPRRPTPRSLGVEVGPWQTILERALSLRARQRHASAAELYEELVASVSEADDAWQQQNLHLPIVAETSSLESATSGTGTGTTYCALPGARASEKRPVRRAQWLAPVAALAIVGVSYGWRRVLAPPAPRDERTLAAPSSSRQSLAAERIIPPPAAIPEGSIASPAPVLSAKVASPRPARRVVQPASSFSAPALGSAPGGALPITSAASAPQPLPYELE
jgi:serine/threonine-protein kinase